MGKHLDESKILLMFEFLRFLSQRYQLFDPSPWYELLEALFFEGRRYDAPLALPLLLADLLFGLRLLQVVPQLGRDHQLELHQSLALYLILRRLPSLVQRYLVPCSVSATLPRCVRSCKCILKLHTSTCKFRWTSGTYFVGSFLKCGSVVFPILL